MSLQDDLIDAVAQDGVHVASFGETFRSLGLWPLGINARNGAAWLLLLGTGFLVWFAEAVLFGRYFPGFPFWPVVGWLTLAAMVAYVPVFLGVAAFITATPAWTVFIDDEHTAIIGFRVRGHELTLNSHLARRLGTGQGRALRETVGQRLSPVLERHPETVIRFRAQHARLAQMYADDLVRMLPGWTHELEGLHGWCAGAVAPQPGRVKSTRTGRWSLLRALPVQARWAVRSRP